MTQLTRPVRDAHAQVEQAARQAAVQARPAIELLARAGYAAKGVVYLLIGGLALMAAAGYGGTTTGSRGALHTLLGKPYGVAILALVAIGLAGYSLWCFVRAILDPERKGSDARGIAKRAFHFGKGVVHAALVVAVIGMMRGTGGGSGSGDEGAQDWTAWLMSFPLGIWLVGATGVGFLLFGLRQIYRAWHVDVDEPLDLGKMGVTAHKWTSHFSRFGMAARGVVFGIIGAFLFMAARHTNPAEARGVGGALEALRRQPSGAALLAAVALGLIAYGCFQFILARYRRIAPV